MSPDTKKSLFSVVILASNVHRQQEKSSVGKKLKRTIILLKMSYIIIKQVFSVVAVVICKHDNDLREV